VPGARPKDTSRKEKGEGWFPRTFVGAEVRHFWCGSRKAREGYAIWRMNTEKGRNERENAESFKHFSREDEAN